MSNEENKPEDKPSCSDASESCCGPKEEAQSSCCTASSCGGGKWISILIILGACGVMAHSMMGGSCPLQMCQTAFSESFSEKITKETSEGTTVLAILSNGDEQSSASTLSATEELSKQFEEKQIKTVVITLQSTEDDYQKLVKELKIKSFPAVVSIDAKNNLNLLDKDNLNTESAQESCSSKTSCCPIK